MVRQNGNLIIISAPSGSGKTTIIQNVMERSERIKFSVSYTTRPPRQGEVSGRDYCFVDETTFKNMIDEEEFYEWAEVHGHLYGTSRTFVESELSAGWDLLLDIDVQGAKKVKEINPGSILIFILPPSYNVLKQRLVARGLDPEKEIKRRLAKARDEIGNFIHYDYIVVNDKLEFSVNNVLSIIQAGRCRVRNNESIVKDILKSFQGEDYV